MEGPLLVLSVCTAGLRRRRLRGFLPQLSWGKHRRRSRSCCLQTPGRAGCHQVDKVSHFARRQDYSQGQRLKWLLFELQSPKHSHTARRRERHMRSPAPRPLPDADTLSDSLFAQRSQHRGGGTYAATMVSVWATKRQALQYRLRRVSLLYTKRLFEEMRRQLCHDTASAEDEIYLHLFLCDWLLRWSVCCDCSSQNEGQKVKFPFKALEILIWCWKISLHKIYVY